MDQVAPSGPVYQAGTLSGNPLAMAAGLATLRAAGQPGFYDRLEQLGSRWREGMGEAASAGSRPFTINQVGSMFSIFFTEQPVTDFASAKTSDLQLFGKYFNSMLNRGAYLAPSQYETLFVSTAITDEVADKYLAANKAALAEHVWGDYIDDANNFDFIYSQIKNLRKKLKDSGAGIELQAVYGLGYKLITE